MPRTSTSPVGPSQLDGATAAANTPGQHLGLLDQLIESTGDGLLEWDVASGRIWYSRRWKMLLGYEDDELPNVVDLWRVLSHPDDLDQVDQILREHLIDFWPFSHAWRMRHRNGDWRSISWRATSLRDDAGTATFMLVLCTDITDRVRAEERQKALATAVPDLMLRIRVDGVVLDEKRAVHGRARSFQIAVGQSLAIGGAADDWAAQAIEATRAAIKSGAVEACDLVAADGTLFLELRAVRSGFDEAVCILRDVTDQKVSDRVQRALQAEVDAMHVAERNRMASELAAAAHIQTALLPALPPIENLEICCQMLPATEVGGDYFDVRACDRGAWLAIGDVSGHGLNAGMIMLMVQSAIACLVTENPSARPGDVLRTTNRVLHQNIRGRLKSDDFITLTLLRYFSDGRLVFSGAHEDMLIFRAADGSVEHVVTPGTWLGIVPDLGRNARETEAQLHPGDMLVLYTDGITEARAAGGAQFGVERLVEAIRAVGDGPVETIRDHVLEAVARWSGRAERDDDQSLMIARYTPAV